MHKILKHVFSDSDIKDVHQTCYRDNLSVLEIDIKDGTQSILMNEQDIIALAEVFNLKVSNK